MKIMVSEVMTREVETVQCSATLREAAEKMRDRCIGALPVYTGKILSGVVTDRDITVRATAEGLSPLDAKVEDVMSWNVEWCPDDTDIDFAARIMESKALRRLVVLNHDGALVGIISLSDIATRTHDSATVEKIIESAASRSAGSLEMDSWESFDESLAD